MTQLTFIELYLGIVGSIQTASPPTDPPTDHRHSSCALGPRIKVVPFVFAWFPVAWSFLCPVRGGPGLRFFFVFLFHPVSAFGVRFGLELFFFDFHTATLLPFCLCNISYPFATTRAKQQKQKKKREANRIKNRRETDKQPLFHPWGWCRILRLVLRPSISSILIRIGIAPALLLLFCSWLTTPIPSLWKSPGFRITLAVWFPFDADKLYVRLGGQRGVKDSRCGGSCIHRII